ncbi:MAG: DUF4982 domain-containing protein, partial [Calditrichota bacterium]
TKAFKDSLQYHLAWQVPYKPGTLSAVGWKDGKKVAQEEVHTAAQSTQIQMEPDRTSLKANGEDLSFLTVRILDSQGNLVPQADNQVAFSVKGAGQLVAVGSGDQLSHESFVTNQRKAFNGMCLAVIRTTRQSGQIEVTASSPGLESASITLETK